MSTARHPLNVEMSHLAFSLDFNPAEYLWNQLGRRMHNGRRQIHNRRDLIDTLVEEWDDFPQYRIYSCFI